VTSTHTGEVRAWYSYGETRLGQGRENVRQFLRDHPELAGEIEGKVREAVWPSKAVLSGDEGTLAESS